MEPSVTLPVLELDGTRESIRDWQMIRETLVDVPDLEKASRRKQYFVAARALSSLARLARVQYAAVKASLDRLEAACMIWRPRPTMRGVNRTVVYIGVLFAPTLTPKLLWNFSLTRYKKALKGDNEQKAERQAGRMAPHVPQLPETDLDCAWTRAFLERASGDGVMLEGTTQPRGRQTARWNGVRHEPERTDSHAEARRGSLSHAAVRFASGFG